MSRRLIDRKVCEECGQRVDIHADGSETGHAERCNHGSPPPAAEGSGDIPASPDVIE